MTPERDTQKSRTSQSDIGYWMGQVDSKLVTLVEKVDCIEANIEQLEAKFDAHVADSLSEAKKDRAEAKEAAEMKDAVTFRYLIDKLGVPLIMGFLYWFLFEVLPHMIKALGD